MSQMCVTCDSEGLIKVPCCKAFDVGEPCTCKNKGYREKECEACGGTGEVDDDEDEIDDEEEDDD